MITTLWACNPRSRPAKERSYDGTLEPPVRQKFAKIRENYNELRLTMEGNYAVVFRAYNEGVAYRLETSLPQTRGKSLRRGIQLQFRRRLPGLLSPGRGLLFAQRAALPADESGHDRAQRDCQPARGGGRRNGVKVAVAESDIEDYPGLWLRGTSGNGLAATFPPYPLKETLEKDRDFKVTQAADYIAVTRGTRSYPWRLLGIAEKDGDLITNQLVYLLAKPSQIQDTSWIKPGKVAWDWWNALNIDGVDFKSGVNTQTYKYFIDFAAKYGIPYIILDEGWYKLGNVLEVVPEVNMEELSAYAKQKNVGIILWMVWKTLDDQFDPAFDRIREMGSQGPQD